ncbi:MAG: SPOR domain-containing protein, partial [Gammaproteobacteria bacterium]
STAPPAAEHAGRDAPAPPDAKPTTDFDFFTELPSIEVLLPPSTPPAPPEAPPASPPPPQPAQPSVRAGDGHRYMLQAASYRTFAEADRLKARLAFAGMKSNIQKISIEGRGDFHRVRLGPYDSIAEMEAARTKLREAGIRDALRFRIKP